MLYEIAITPDVFEDALSDDHHRAASELRQLLGELTHCGMVANLNGEQWHDHVEHLLTRRTDSIGYAKDLQEALKVLKTRKRLVLHGMPEQAKPTTKRALARPCSRVRSRDSA